MKNEREEDGNEDVKEGRKEGRKKPTSVNCSILLHTCIWVPGMWGMYCKMYLN
jgi:hypothetical protein